MKHLFFNISSSSNGLCNLTNGTLPTRSTSVASFPRHSAQETLIFVTIYSLLSFLVILGNSLIIMVFTRNDKLRTATNMFFVSLAVSDFIVGAISIPCWMYILLYDLNNTSQSAVNLQFRKVYKFLDVCSALTSIAHLTIISIERNIAISKPLRHRVMRRYHYYCAIAATWAYGLIIAGVFVSDFKVAMWRRYKGLLSTIAGFFLPLLVIIFMYANIYKSVKLFNIRRRSYSISSLQRKVHLERTTAKTVLIVTGLFVLSWLPFFTLSVLFIFRPSYLPRGTNLMHLVDFVKLLHYSNSAINPLVYTYRIAEVRSTLMRIIAPCLVQTDVPSARSLPVPLAVQKSPPKGPRKLHHCFAKACVDSVNGRDVNL